MMEYGPYLIKFDRTGFPLIQRKGWGYYISLFPVSKYQFERFMAETGPRENLYTDEWYREKLKVTPRKPWKNWDQEPWKLFMTGLSKNELMDFLEYLGEGFRLPDQEEWKKLHQCSEDIQKTIQSHIEKIKNEWLFAAPPVTFWLEKNLYPLTAEGILEMTEDESTNTINCIGKPYQNILPNTWSPETIKVVNWDIAGRFVGFRVVCKEAGYVA